MHETLALMFVRLSITRANLNKRYNNLDYIEYFHYNIHTHAQSL